MRFAYENLIEDAGLSADSEYSVDTFRAKNILDRQTGKRWRSFRSPNLMLYGNCDSANSPTIDGIPIACVNGTWARDENMKYEGVSSWCLTKTTAAGGGIAYQELQDNASTTDMHGLIARTTYEWKCKLRTSAVPVRAAISIWQRIAAAWVETATQTCIVSHAWEQKSIYTTIFSGATAVIVRISLGTAAEIGTKVWLDKSIFYVKNDYIKNGKCEFTDSPTLDGGITGLTGGTWAQSAAQFHSGATSWRLDKTTAAGAGTAYVYLTDNIVTTDMHGLTAGKTYLADFWMYLDGIITPANAVIVLQQYYSGVWNNTYLGIGAAVGAWSNKTKTVTINPLTTGITLLIQIASAEPVTSKIYLDDIQFMLEPRLTIDLYNAAAPQYAAIIGHNLSSSAVIKVEANTSASWTTPAVSETMTLADLMLHTMTNAVAYRYWSFVFSDYDYNEDGYIEIGYGAIGDYFQPTNGAARVFQETPDDMSAVNTTITGEVMGSIAGLMDGWEINIPTMNTATKTLFEAMYAEVRNHTPFIFVLDQSLTAYFPVKYVYFVGNSPYKFTHIMTLDQWACSFTIKECI